MRNLSLPPAVRQSARPTVCFATAASRKKGSYFSSLLCCKSENPSETSDNYRRSIILLSPLRLSLLLPSFPHSHARSSLVLQCSQWWGRERRTDGSTAVFRGGAVTRVFVPRSHWVTVSRHVLHCSLVSSSYLVHKSRTIFFL